MCSDFGEIAQLARALGSYPKGRGFDSPSRYHVINTRYEFAVNTCLGHVSFFPIKEVKIWPTNNIQYKI